MLVSVCDKAFGKIGKDEKGKAGIHSGAFLKLKNLNWLIFPYIYGQLVEEILCFRRKYTRNMESLPAISHERPI